MHHLSFYRHVWPGAGVLGPQAQGLCGSQDCAQRGQVQARSNDRGERCWLRHCSCTTPAASCPTLSFCQRRCLVAEAGCVEGLLVHPTAADLLADLPACLLAWLQLEVLNTLERNDPDAKRCVGVPSSFGRTSRGGCQQQRRRQQQLLAHQRLSMLQQARAAKQQVWAQCLQQLGQPAAAADGVSSRS